MNISRSSSRSGSCFETGFSPTLAGGDVLHEVSEVFVRIGFDVAAGEDYFEQELLLSFKMLDFFAWVLYNTSIGELLDKPKFL
ncbi:MAG TPA: hypothetical protein DCR07_00515 [Lactococcus sp.]|nr:hypothetical protein [Lactococcus sp.]